MKSDVNVKMEYSEDMLMDISRSNLPYGQMKERMIDEIWFAAENERHESEIYSLYEIRRENNERVNSTAAYDKQYLEGRYGADPYLTNMLAGGEWQ